MRPEDLDPVRLGELISTLPPTHPLVAAARGAVDVSDGRAEEAAVQREVQADVREGIRELPTDPPSFGSGVHAMHEQQAADSRFLAEQARGRAETADRQERAHLEAEAQAHDERAERMEQRVAANYAGTWGKPDEPTDEQRALTSALVAEAREYLADQQLREDQRYLDGGVTRDDSAAEETDDGADDTAEMCASR